jgi:hypothetical protein
MMTEAPGATVDVGVVLLIVGNVVVGGIAAAAGALPRVAEDLDGVAETGIASLERRAKPVAVPPAATTATTAIAARVRPAKRLRNPVGMFVPSPISFSQHGRDS